jgi:hypothetical protein
MEAMFVDIGTLFSKSWEIRQTLRGGGVPTVDNFLKESIGTLFETLPGDLMGYLDMSLFDIDPRVVLEMNLDGDLGFVVLGDIDI